MKNYETELPQNYKLAKTIDAKNAKIGVVLNLIALAVVIVCVLVAYFIIKPSPSPIDLNFYIIRLLVFIVIFAVYIILHELVHGAAYKALTKQKLTFGLTLTVAFCGVPHIYVYRKTALIAVLAPFVVFLPVFSVLCFLLPNDFDKMLAAAMLGLHVGGCSGDLWVAGLLLFKLRGKTTLMNDTGPKQTFYVLSDNETAEQLIFEDTETDKQ